MLWGVGQLVIVISLIDSDPRSLELSKNFRDHLCQKVDKYRFPSF